MVLRREDPSLAAQCKCATAKNRKVKEPREKPAPAHSCNCSEAYKAMATPNSPTDGGQPTKKRRTEVVDEAEEAGGNTCDGSSVSSHERDGLPTHNSSDGTAPRAQSDVKLLPGAVQCRPVTAHGTFLRIITVSGIPSSPIFEYI